MESNNRTLDIFAFITHEFAPMIQEFRETIRSAPQFAPFAARAGSADCDVHADLKAQRFHSGQWTLQRAYWSLQHASSDGVSYDAHMVYWKSAEQPHIVSFPHDPYMKTMHDVIAGAHREGVGIDVLRYVPLRRLTFRARKRGDAAGRIGKLKRRSTIRESCERLRTVHRAWRTAGASFTVAAPLEFDEAACVFYQEVLPGVGLTHGLTAADVRVRLAQVGRIHRELHGLEVPGLPAWTLERYRQVIGDDVRWIELFRPQAARRLEPVLATLDATAPSSPRRNHVFCHGAFVPSQLLLDGERVAVTDFDAARSGDAYQEMGKLLAGLKYDLPHLRESLHRGDPLDSAAMCDAEEAYLTGYAQFAGEPIDRKRLRWFRTCAEIHHLALSLKKDAWSAVGFESTVDAVVASAARLGKVPA